MKNHSVLAMLLLDAYALLCIYLLLTLFTDGDMTVFSFMQMRN
jgi:hypothetical protein